MSNGDLAFNPERPDGNTLGDYSFPNPENALRPRQRPLVGRTLPAALNVALLRGWGIHEDDVSITGRRHPEGVASVPTAIIQEREAGSNSSIGFSSGSSS
jgi:hypothetical protein